ncbi:hypothetical protein [Silvibacterium acidisoli]|uniref:hypothetical protein n=1 Tax=Acidobacteriaceae bacterium ZG23-2 TaxID=2883246 RepID=UPI00406C6827
MERLTSLETFVANWLSGLIRPCLEGLELLNGYVTTSPTAAELDGNRLTKLTTPDLREKLQAWTDFEEHRRNCPQCSRIKPAPLWVQ